MGWDSKVQHHAVSVRIRGVKTQAWGIKIESQGWLGKINGRKKESQNQWKVLRSTIFREIEADTRATRKQWETQIARDAIEN